MKTLKKNINKAVSPVWSKVVKCTGKGPLVNLKPCGSILELHVSDIRYISVPAAYMTDTEVYGFICKECRCFTKINIINLPKWVREKARKLKIEGEL